MVLIVGHNGRSAYTSTITGRTEQSGGSLGGVKKAGTAPYISFPRGNMGNFLMRAPQRTPTLLFSMTNTTKNPTQGKSGYAVRISSKL